MTCSVCVCEGAKIHLLQQLILVHVLLGGVAGALCLLLEGFVRSHERGLLGEQCGQATQQPTKSKHTVIKEVTQVTGL